RSRPLVSAVVITTATMAMIADVSPLTVSAFLALLTVLYIVATRYSRGFSIVFATPFVVNLIAPLPGSTASLGAAPTFVLVVAAQPPGAAERRKDRVIAERDASRAAMADSVRERTALEERARIAREMHDVVAHHVSMIAVQADATRLTTPDMPE